MEFVVVAFRSRAQTVKFSEHLNKFNIANEIINTPKEAGVGCGLSIKISKMALPIVKKMLQLSNLSSFAGIFLVSIYGGKRLVRSI